MAKARNKRNHLSPHRAWTYLHADTSLSPEEHDHILECERCLHIFIICLKSDSFGLVLKQVSAIYPDTAERRSA
jgi:hypothetical protein